MACLEALFIIMNRDASLKHSSNATIVSENSWVNHSTLITLLGPMIAEKYGIYLSRYVYTETSDGKYDLEGSFVS